jgi:hypothetical protein
VKKQNKKTMQKKSEIPRQPSLPATTLTWHTYPNRHIKRIVQKDQPKRMVKPKFANPKPYIPISSCISGVKYKSSLKKDISHPYS